MGNYPSHSDFGTSNYSGIISLSIKGFKRDKKVSLVPAAFYLGQNGLELQDPSTEGVQGSMFATSQSLKSVLARAISRAGSDRKCFSWSSLVESVGGNTGLMNSKILIKNSYTASHVMFIIDADGYRNTSPHFISKTYSFSD